MIFKYIGKQSIGIYRHNVINLLFLSCILILNEVRPIVYVDKSRHSILRRKHNEII